MSDVDATIDVIGEADLEAVAAFLTAQAAELKLVPTPSNLSPAARLRWLLLENPSRHADVPFGWCVRAAGGRVAGAMICVPLRFAARDFACTAVMICKFFVEKSMRRSGFGSQMLARFLDLAARFPLFASSANAASGALFGGAGGYVIPGTDHTMIGVGRLRPLVEEWLYRRAKRPMAARVLALPMGLVPGRLRGLAHRGLEEGKLTALKSAEEVGALGLRRPEDVLAVVRDVDHVRWRYFSGEGEQDVFAFRAREGDAHLVVMNQVRSGYRSQLRVLNVLDVWPPLNADAATGLAGLLAREYAGQFDALWLRSQSADVEEALSHAGFMRHLFPAPLGWCIDPLQLIPTRNWYLMPGEAE